MTHEEDEEFAEVYERLKAQDLPPADPFQGPSGRIGGGTSNKMIPVPGTRIGGGWYGYTSSSPKPGEPEYVKTKIANRVYWVFFIAGAALILYALWQHHPLW